MCETNETVYKIRYPDGKFSTGGKYPDSMPLGKTWSNINAVMHHLSLVSKNEGIYSYPPGTMLVRYEIVETESVPIVSHDLSAAQVLAQ